MTSSKKPDLILSTVWGYSFPELEPFLKTLKQTSFDGEIVFFCAQMSPKTIAKLKAWGVTVIPFARPYPYVDADLAARNPWGEMPDAGFFFFCLRHLLYYLFLKKNGDRYGKIFLTDIRDVIFQGNPFDFEITGLTAFQEREGFAIQDQYSNRTWIQKTFGPEVYEKLRAQPIICAGTTYGTPEALLRYAEAMVTTIYDRNGSNNDQGIHNYVIRMGLVSKVTIYENNVGPVLTVGIEDTIHLNREGRIINSHGAVPLVVHQYDRHYQIAKRYYSRGLRLKFWWLHHSPRALASNVRYRSAVVLKKYFPHLHTTLKEAVRGGA